MSQGNPKEIILFALFRESILKDLLLSSTFYTACPCASGKNNLFNITSSSLFTSPPFPSINLYKPPNSENQTIWFKVPQREGKQYSENINSAMFFFLALRLQNLLRHHPRRATPSLSIEHVTHRAF